MTSDPTDFEILSRLAPSSPFKIDPPHSLEAEQALLGALLSDNQAMIKIDGQVKPRDFYEPFHGKLYEAMAAASHAGHSFDPILLGRKFDSDSRFEELGGLRYLADLEDRAPPAVTAPDYAREVYDLAARRDVLTLCAQQAVAAVMGETDAATMLEEFDKALMGMRQGNRALMLEDIGDVIERIDAHVNDPEPKARGPLLGCGLEEIGEIAPGKFLILAGRPSMGKSALAGGIVLAISKQTDSLGRPYGTIHINGEMDAAEMVMRHIADEGFRIDPHNAPSYREIETRKMNDQQRLVYAQAARAIRNLPMKVIKRTGITIGQIRSICRRQKGIWEAKGIVLAAVVLDHMGLARPDKGGRDMFADQTLVAMAGKELADELECAVIGLVQVSRNAEARDDKRPGLPDLKNAGAYEENADIVIGVYREAYYANKEPEPTQDSKGAKDAMKWADWDARKKSKVIEAIVLKFRAGATGTHRLWGDMPRNAIRAEAPHDDGPMLSDEWAFE